MEEENNQSYKIIYPLLFLFILWFIRFFEEISGISFIRLGLAPGSSKGLAGIFLAPLIHADYGHLIANSLPLLILGVGLFYFFPGASFKVFLLIYFIPNIFVWLFAREGAYHIGASGIIYGLVSFIFFSGLIRRDVRSIALALVVTFLYGSFIWGVLPLDRKVSWESHLFGALTGIVCAVLFRKTDPYKKYDWEDEEDDDNKNNNDKPEISYTKGYPWDEE